MSRDLLDDLLDRSAPATRAAEPKDLAALSTAARDAATRRRRLPRVAIGVGIAALLVGGAGVAVANDLIWSSWVTVPVGSYSFTLPSGATCTTQSGDVESADPAVQAAVEEFYRGDPMSRVDVDSALAELRADPVVATLEDGSTEVLVPGSPHFSFDEEYKLAIGVAVGDALAAHLAERGIPRGEHTALGETLCSNDPVAP